MNPYLEYVESIQSGVESAKGRSVVGRIEPVRSERKTLLFSPHPDDECIIGLLPLRLMREAGHEIVNIPVTFGSNRERRAGRLKELEDACAYLGWSNYRDSEELESLEVDGVVRILEKFRPEAIVFPHVEDWNSRHIETHRLLVAGLERMGKDFSCLVIESEFWGAMDDPNLMVEGDAETVADLVAATSLHTEEVARNPYHLLLPAWMQDNVRRGGELVGGQGEAAPDFSFATLYRLRRWQSGGFVSVLEGGTAIAAGADALKRVLDRVS